MIRYRTPLTLAAASVLFAASHSPLLAQATAEAKSKSEKSKPIKMVDSTLARGAITLKVAESWEKPKKARSRIIESEFSVPAAKGDKVPGRLTMMRSGGSLKQNIDRWIGQFTQPDGKPTKDVAKVTEKKVHGQEVTVVDISGTFKETMGGGPFAPGKTVVREDYRMLGGIAQTAAGQYFFKLYGPKTTVAEAEKAFNQMIDSIAPTKRD